MADETRRDARTVILAVLHGGYDRLPDGPSDWDTEADAILDELAAAGIGLAGPGEVVIGREEYRSLLAENWEAQGWLSGDEYANGVLAAMDAAARTPAPEEESPCAS